jgi:hypothetical protein
MQRINILDCSLKYKFGVWFVRKSERMISVNHKNIKINIIRKKYNEIPLSFPVVDGIRPRL